MIVRETFLCLEYIGVILIFEKRQFTQLDLHFPC